MHTYPFRVACFVVLALLSTSAQEAKVPVPALPGAEYSGMYSFLRDGEFVQITVEEKGRVTGFVSRYGDLESDRARSSTISSSRANWRATNSTSPPRRFTASGSSFEAAWNGARARSPGTRRFMF